MLDIRRLNNIISPLFVQYPICCSSQWYCDGRRGRDICSWEIQVQGVLINMGKKVQGVPINMGITTIFKSKTKFKNIFF